MSARLEVRWQRYRKERVEAVHLDRQPDGEQHNWRASVLRCVLECFVAQFITLMPIALTCFLLLVLKSNKHHFSVTAPWHDYRSGWCRLPPLARCLSDITVDSAYFSVLVVYNREGERG